MKIRVSQIDIPIPCDEKWNEMTSKSNGRFCDSCSKTVVDFTSLSDPKVLGLLERSSDQLCGRFRRDQLDDLNRILNRPRKSSSSWKAAAVAILGTSLSVSQNVAAQSPQSHIVQSVFPNGSLIPVDEVGMLDKGGVADLRGLVVDSESKEALPGVNILVKDTEIGMVSDLEGIFELKIDSLLEQKRDSLTLVFRYVGYVSQEISLRGLDLQNLKVFMVEDEITLGEVVVGELVVEQAPLHKRIIGRIRELF